MKYSIWETEKIPRKMPKLSKISKNCQKSAEIGNNRQKQPKQAETPQIGTFRQNKTSISIGNSTKGA